MGDMQQRRVPEEVLRMMEQPLEVADGAARSESAARLEAWVAELERVAPPAAPPAAAIVAALAEEQRTAREERKRQAATLLQQLDALSARPSVFDEDSVASIFMTVQQDRWLKRKLGAK